MAVWTFLCPHVSCRGSASPTSATLAPRLRVKAHVTLLYSVMLTVLWHVQHCSDLLHGHICCCGKAAPHSHEVGADYEPIALQQPAANGTTTPDLLVHVSHHCQYSVLLGLPRSAFLSHGCAGSCMSCKPVGRLQQSS